MPVRAKLLATSVEFEPNSRKMPSAKCGFFFSELTLLDTALLPVMSWPIHSGHLFIAAWQAEWISVWIIDVAQPFWTGKAVCEGERIVYRAASKLTPSQWETSLQSNAVSHWLGTNLESALVYPVEYDLGGDMCCIVQRVDLI